MYVNSVSTSISTDTTIWQLGTTSCKKLLDKFGFDAVHAPGTRLFADLYRANLQESS